MWHCLYNFKLLSVCILLVSTVKCTVLYKCGRFTVINEPESSTTNTTKYKEDIPIRVNDSPKIAEYEASTGSATAESSGH